MHNTVQWWATMHRRVSRRCCSVHANLISNSQAHICSFFFVFLFGFKGHLWLLPDFVSTIRTLIGYTMRRPPKNILGWNFWSWMCKMCCNPTLQKFRDLRRKTKLNCLALYGNIISCAKLLHNTSVKLNRQAMFFWFSIKGWWVKKCNFGFYFG